MTDQAPELKKKVKPKKSDFQMELDEVIRSLEEAAREIEKADWEHAGSASKDRAMRRTTGETKKVGSKS